MKEKKSKLFLTAFFAVVFFWAGLFLSGCGDVTGTNDRGFPKQVSLQSRAGRVSGSIQLPPSVANANIQADRLRLSTSMVDGFEVYALCSPDSEFGILDSKLNKKIVSGIVDANGNYFIEGLPFNESVTIVAKKGKIVFQKKTEVMSLEIDALSYLLGVNSTAETLLLEAYLQEYESQHGQTKNMKETLEILEKARRILEDDIKNLANILEAEIANEHSDDDLPITERGLVVNQVQFITTERIANNKPNNLPYVKIEAIAQNQRGVAEIKFYLIDAEGDAANVGLFYCLRQGSETCAKDSDSSYSSLSQDPSQAISLNNMLTKNDLGRLYVINWASVADLGAGKIHEVRVRIDTWPSDKSKKPENTNSHYTVVFNIDNTGLGDISQITILDEASNERLNHSIGLESILLLEGAGFHTVSEVFLEYYGTNSFISPRSFPLNILDSSSEIIRTELPSYGFFPADYRVVLLGMRPEEKSVSSAEQLVTVIEKYAPDSVTNLTPSSGYNHEIVNIYFDGYNLTGVFDGFASLKDSHNQTFPIESISAEHLSSGIIRWSGRINTGLSAGNYQIWLKNTCEGIGCGEFKQVLLATPYRVLEKTSVISSVVLSTGFGGGGYNGDNNKIAITGSRMSSVSEVRVGQNRLDLINNFPTTGQSVTIAGTSYQQIEIIYPFGSSPGEFYVGLKNESGITVSNQTFSIFEGLIPAQATVKLFSDAAFSAELSTSVAHFNTQTIYIQIEGQNLSSLHRISFEKSGLIFDEDLWEAPSYNRARVALPPGYAPGNYGIRLFNAQPQYVTLECNSGTCFSLKENPPQVTNFENISGTVQLGKKEMYAWEGQLKVSGSHLAGTTSIEICASTFDTSCTVLSCPSPAFNTAVSVAMQSSYLLPGSYLLRVNNSVGSFETATELVVVEKTPFIQRYYPSTFSSRDLQSDQTIYFEGDYLYGTNKIVLTTNCNTNVLSSDIAYAFVGSQIQAFSRNEVQLLNPKDIIPGEYYFRIFNYTPAGGAFKNYSACVSYTHKFTVTEPELNFLQFDNPDDPALPTVISLPNHELTTVFFVGEFLYGLNEVKLRRRDPAILNISQEYTAIITGDKMQTYASFLVEPGLLPGNYDLLLKNTVMPVAVVQDATVRLTEVVTPELSYVELYGANDVNTGLIVYNIFGQAIDGVGLFTKRVDLIDRRDGRRVPLPTTGIELMALASNHERYLRVQIPANTLGAPYYFSVINSSYQSSAEVAGAYITVYEPRAVFNSVGVLDPPDPSFGFGENDRKLKLEIRGQNLSSVKSIEFHGENMPSSPIISLGENVIERRFPGADVTLITTLPTDLRPGYYNLRLLNNNKSEQWSAWISPIESPFFQQVLIREGAPIIDRMGCLDPTFADANCQATFMTRNYEGYINIKITGRNFYTFRRLRVFRADKYVPEMDFQLPSGYVMGDNLNSASTGILSHTSKTIEVKLPRYMKYIGAYDIELTNSVSTRRFKQKLKVTEEFPLTIDSTYPNGAAGNIIYNNMDRELLLSGAHFTGTTYVALHSATTSTKLTDLDYELVVSSLDTPIKQMNVILPENLFPDRYKIEARNTKGFNSVGSSSFLTVSELAPSIYDLSSFAITNVETQVITMSGGGFLGLNNLVLKPADSGNAKTKNENMGVLHQPITISAADINILSHSELEFTVHKQQLPGFYRFSMSNTNPSSYNGAQDFEIQEENPTILTISPDWMNYSDETTLTITGTSLYGVTGTVASQSWARLVHSTNQAVARYFDSDEIIGKPTFNTLRINIGKNLMLGRYELEVKNSVGEGSSKTVTQFWVKEGLISLNEVSKTTFSYRYGEMPLAQRKFDLVGKHFQGVKRIWISTSIHNTDYKYGVDLASCTHDPYISLSGCMLETDLVYPGQYLLSLENSAGVSSPATPVFDFILPSGVSSNITSYTPQSGPFNSATEIIFTGQNVRRMEYLRFRRLLALGDADDNKVLIDVHATPPVYPNPALFSEIDNNSFKAIFRPAGAVFAEGASGSQNAFAIDAKGYFQATTTTFDSDTFKLDGNFPSILGFEECSVGVVTKTSDYYQSGGISLCTTSALDGLPMTLTLSGANFIDIQRIKLRRKDSSVVWTLACTTGTGSSSFNGGTLTTVEVTVPDNIFTIPHSGSTLCGNDPSLLPLQPGVYAFIVEGVNGISGYEAQSASFYFSENSPNNLTVSQKLQNTAYNDEDVSYYVFDYGWNLLGATHYRIYKTAYGAVDLTFPIDKTAISRHATEEHAYFEFTIPKGVLRGLKPKQAGFHYDLDVLNSRGWTTGGPGSFDHQEKAPVISSVLPNSGGIFTTQVVIVNGNHLMGVGRSTGGLYGTTVNQVRLWNLESYQNDDLTTISVDITDSVTVQTLTSFVAVVPNGIRPGKWFFSVENDHQETGIGINPGLFPAVTYTVMDSTPIVTSVTPLVSEFDELPTSMVLRGEYLSGVRTAVLDLKDGPVPQTVTLSLYSYPDLTSSNFGSVAFSLPQSPDFLQPGTWTIKLQNSIDEFEVSGFELSILEKQPFIYQINPISHSSFINTTIVSFDIIGDNLFGYPSVSIELNACTVPISVAGGVVQSRELLHNLEMPHSLYPDTWLLSVKNSIGSTSMSVIITEPVVRIDEIIPDTVPFDNWTEIELRGDHFLGVSTNPGSAVLTDILRTPLEDIELYDRYKIKVLVPEGVHPGKYEILVSNKAGRNTTSAFLTVSGSGLSIDSISPNTGHAKGGDFLTIIGSGFVEGSRVTIGGVLAMDVMVYPNKLEVFLPPASSSVDLSSGQQWVDVSVYNPDGQMVTKVGFFKYVRDFGIAPRVKTVFPGALSGTGPIGVHLNSKIAVLFDMPVQPETVIGDGPGDYRALEVLSDTATISGTIAWAPTEDTYVYDNKGMFFIPSKKVEVGLSNRILNAEGIALVTSDTITTDGTFFEWDTFIEDWAFTAGSTSDSAALAIASPSGSSNSVNLSQVLTIVFNKASNPLTLHATDFILTQLNNNHIIPVNLELGSDGKTVYVDPDELLQPNFSYTLRIKSQRLESLTGNKMTADWVHNINTVQSGPHLVSVYPLHEQSAVAVNTLIIVEFDQAMAENTVNLSNLFVSDIAADEKLGGEFITNEEKTFYTLRLGEQLQAGKSYEITVANRIKSLTGVFLTAGQTSVFDASTDNYTDLSPPVISSIFPSHGADAVSTAVSIIVSFSEYVHPADITTENFRLYFVDSVGLETLTTVSIAWDGNLTAVIMSPSEPLEYEGRYRISINDGIRDLCDNTLVHSISSQFTVIHHFDQEGPNIVNITPSNGDLNVLVNSRIIIIFNEPIDPTSMISQNFVLQTTDGVPVIGSLVAFDGFKRIEFTPERLYKNTGYQFTVSENILDIHGNVSGINTITTFRTEDYLDDMEPIISLVTLNETPDILNGWDINANQPSYIVDAQSNLRTPVLYVPENGFLISVEYYDPGEGGESSGVDSSSLVIKTSKQVTAAGGENLVNTNLIEKAQPVYVRHYDGGSQLTIPWNWAFASGQHEITATVKDYAGNLSNEQTFKFKVQTTTDNHSNYPFNNNKVSQFSLEFNGDSYSIAGAVQQGLLRVNTVYATNGFLDFYEDMALMGLIDCYPDNCPVTVREIVNEVITLTKQSILYELRALFDQDGNGNQLNSSEKKTVNFVLEAGAGSYSRLLIGGDNGEDAGGGLIEKSTERSKYNTANRIETQPLNERTRGREEGSGVFTSHLVRKYANDTQAFSEWQKRFAHVSRLAYGNVLEGGKGVGLPIGSLYIDADIYQRKAQLEGKPSCVTYFDTPARQACRANTPDYSDIGGLEGQGLFERRERFWHVFDALQAWSRLVAVSAAKVVAMAVGAVPKGIPPEGFYGGESQLGLFFVSEQTVDNFHQPLFKNNIMRRNIDFNSVFAPPPSQIGFAPYAWHYMQNRVWVDN